MTGPGQLEAFEKPLAAPQAGNVVVQVAGCGICHTDLGYLYDAIPTKKALPLVLGHEVAGVVVDTAADTGAWKGRRVVVPAVLPCGKCKWCKARRSTACRASLMPGNDIDGGFASHLEVGAASLCPVDAPGSTPPLDQPVGPDRLGLWELAVVADAVTTPLQAIRRCGLQTGELAVVIGAGGIGIFGVEIAAGEGAKVVAIDVNPKRLERAKALGAGLVLDAKEDPKTMKKAIRAYAEAAGAPSEGWRILEMSGHAKGQELAWSLLTTGGSVSVVGFTAEATKLRLSNLMAFDATAYGNWGCDPSLYPEALGLIASGKLKLKGLVRRESLADAPKVIEAVHRGEYEERVVLVP